MLPSLSSHTRALILRCAVLAGILVVLALFLFTTQTIVKDSGETVKLGGLYTYWTAKNSSKQDIYCVVKVVGMTNSAINLIVYENKFRGEPIAVKISDLLPPSEKDVKAFETLSPIQFFARKPKLIGEAKVTQPDRDQHEYWTKSQTKELPTPSPRPKFYFPSEGVMEGGF